MISSASPVRSRSISRLLGSVLFALGAISQAVAEAPSNERIVSLPSLTGTAPSSVAWSPDSSRVAFLWNDEGMPFRDVWVVDADGGGIRRLTQLAPRDAPKPEPGQSREAMAERIEARMQTGVSELLWSPDSRRVLYGHRGRLFEVAAGGGGARLVLDDGGRRSSFAFSPDGSRIAFIESNDLFIHDFQRNTTERATEIGVPGIGRVPVGAFNRPDAGVSRFRWSPDGRYIAFESVDRSDVRRVPIPSYLHGEEPFLHEVRRAYPGDRDLVTRLAVIDTRTHEVRTLSLELPRQRLFHEFSWAPDGSELLIHQGSDVGEDRWLRVADAETGQVRELWHDHRPRRIYPIFQAIWSADGEKVIFLGDTDGYYRLYSIDAEGGAAEILTSGDYDVAGSGYSGYIDVAVEPAVERSGSDSDADEAPHGAVFFVASRKSPYERHLYRMVAGDDPVRITQRAGVHEPRVSPDGRHFASVMSSDLRPAELYIGAVDSQDASGRVTQSPPEAFYEYDWIRPRYVTFPSRIDGYTLHARIVAPRKMEPGARFPVLIGNIYSNTVRNAWDSSRPTTNLQQRLALTGEYIHVQVDLRGSLGYGVDFREAFQGAWGGDDLEDLLSAVDYLKTLDYVDPDRIGLWGNSYGGLMVLAALFKHPGVFAAGVAGAPAVDVGHFTGFDQHLTRRPDTHPEIFAGGSLLDLGEELADPLLIIHGMHDDIVPYKTTLMMTDKLMMLGKDFDLISMPNAPHWWAAPEHYGIYTFRKLEDFFRRHVPPGPLLAPKQEDRP